VLSMTRCRCSLESFGDAHQNIIHPAAIITGERANHDADDDRDQGRDDANQQRDACTMENASHDIATELVGAERCCTIDERPDKWIASAAQRIAGDNEIGQKRDQDHGDEKDEAEHSSAVAAEALPQNFRAGHRRASEGEVLGCHDSSILESSRA
jgi:hypothetical protein